MAGDWMDTFNFSGYPECLTGNPWFFPTNNGSHFCSALRQYVALSHSGSDERKTINLLSSWWGSMGRTQTHHVIPLPHNNNNYYNTEYPPIAYHTTSVSFSTALRIMLVTVVLSAGGFCPDLLFPSRSLLPLQQHVSIMWRGFQFFFSSFCPFLWG
jgi:hypothetical protein